MFNILTFNHLELFKNDSSHLCQPIIAVKAMFLTTLRKIKKELVEKEILTLFKNVGFSISTSETNENVFLSFHFSFVSVCLPVFP